MNNMSKWIEHLHHPLVFAGFGLFLLALLLRPLFLNNKKLSGTAIERLLGKGMILVFVLALLAIIGGVALNWQQSSAERKQSTGPSVSVQEVAQSPAKEQKPAPSSLKEPTAENKQGANLSISASGQGQVSVGGDVTYGLNEEKLNAMLEQREDRLIQKLLAASGDKKERLLLEKQLKTLREQKADLMARYNDRLKGTIDQYERNIRRNIHDRKGVRMNLTTAQNERNKLQSVVAQGRQEVERMSDPNQRRAYKSQLRQLEREVHDLNLSIRRLKNIYYARVK